MNKYLPTLLIGALLQTFSTTVLNKDHIITNNRLDNEELQPFTGITESFRRRLHSIRKSQITESSVKRLPQPIKNNF